MAAGAAVAYQALAGPLSVDATVGDVLQHPAFAAFGYLLLPSDQDRRKPTLALRNLASLLPYHTNVNTASVVSSLNRLIDDARDGRQIFYDIYTEAEKRADSSRRETGLFFLRGKPGAPFAVIAPGGGFAYVGSLHEGFPYAVEINNRGYHAFVLKYRTGRGGAAATEDLAAAISYIFRNADVLSVSKANYSLWGSSAGARMAAAIGSHGIARYGGSDLPKPTTVVLLYSAHSDVAAVEPPTFVVVGEHDRIAPPAIMKKRVAALRRQGTPVEFREYPGVGHGFGLGVGTRAEGWIAEAIAFWAKRWPLPTAGS